MPPFVTDGERLRTALVNLLANARHAVRAVAASPGAGRGAAVATIDEPAVRVQTRFQSGRALISIRDSGIGIAPEDMPHIFDPYFTTRRAGTGLGLPITKNIIEGLGGTLAVSSRVGEGTDIRIDLPQRTADAHA